MVTMVVVVRHRFALSGVCGGGNPLRTTKRSHHGDSGGGGGDVSLEKLAGFSLDRRENSAGFSSSEASIFFFATIIAAFLTTARRVALWYVD